MGDVLEDWIGKVDEEKDIIMRTEWERNIGRKRTEEERKEESIGIIIISIVLMICYVYNNSNI